VGPPQKHPPPQDKGRPCSRGATEPSAGGLRGSHSQLRYRSGPRRQPCREPWWGAARRGPPGLRGSSARPSPGLGDSRGCSRRGERREAAAPRPALTSEVAVVAQVAAHEAVVGLGAQPSASPPLRPVPGVPRGPHGCQRRGAALLRCREQGRGR